MTNKIYIGLILLLSAVFVGCKDDQLSRQELEISNNSRTVDINSNGLNEDMLVRGKLYVKLKKGRQDRFFCSSTGQVTLNAVPTQFGITLNNIGASRMERLFPHAGKFEARTKASGLDRWYTVYYYEQTSPIQACAMMQKLDEVEISEPCYLTIIPDTQITPFTNDTNETSNLPFNDPLLKDQWHYHNTGVKPNYVAGADCNLFKAWEREVGKSNVIVSVVDGGIDVTHPDLIDNLYTNEAELNGQQGVDDDGNGFVDDIHGYCFVNDKQSGNVFPDGFSHGTHVAGTIAARNNNGIGVAGIAGGDGTPGSGVRVMSCQCFGKITNANTGSLEGGNSAAAIKYGADNGAVISQNSWGFPYSSGIRNLPTYIKDAIDYFIRYAGCDNNGNQLPNSPMKGGVVIFAAGNDGLEFVAYPGAYEKCIAVASFGPDMKAAHYTTYGTWVDICAPGGNQGGKFGSTGGVLSTMAKSVTGSEYGYMQGTSMACPHVSGIAALIVSHYGGPGFTAEMLKKHLLGGLLPYNIDNINPTYTGKLGVGYIDAAAVFDSDENNTAPEKVNLLSPVPSYTNITFKFTPAKDKEQGYASRYKLYVSPTALNENNLSNATVYNINGIGFTDKDVITYKLDNLTPDKKYYYAVVALDRWGKGSEPAFGQISTLINLPPNVEGLPEKEVIVTQKNDVSLVLKVTDPEGFSWAYKAEGDIKGNSIYKENDKIHIKLRAINDPGDYKINLILTDILGATKTYTLKYKIHQYIEPKLIASFDNMIIGKNNGALNVVLTDKFRYDPYSTPSFKAMSNNSNIVSVKVDESNNLILTPYKIGEAIVTILFSDGSQKGYIKTAFNIKVVENSIAGIYAIYPVPVQKHLKALVNPSLKKVTFILQSTNGEEVIRKTVNKDFNNIADINLSSLSSGIYRLYIESDMETYTKTIIKQ